MQTPGLPAAQYVTQNFAVHSPSPPLRYTTETDRGRAVCKFSDAAPRTLERWGETVFGSVPAASMSLVGVAW